MRRISRTPSRVKRKQRRIESAYLIERDGVEEVRLQGSGKYWHTVTPAGPKYLCKCPQHAHVISWFEDIPAYMHLLLAHRDELWNLICDGEAVLLVPPDAQHQGKPFNTRLVSVIWPTDGILTFVS